MSEVRGAMATWGDGRAGAAAGLRGACRRGRRARAQAGRGHAWGASSTTRSTRSTRALGRLPLPGGRTIPVKNVLGYGIAATAVLIQVERYLRRTRELKPL